MNSSSSKKGNFLAIFAIFAIIVSVFYRYFAYSHVAADFHVWILAGTFAGILGSVFCLWKFNPQKKKSEIVLGVTAITMIFSLGIFFIQYGFDYSSTTHSVRDWDTVTGKITGQSIFESAPTKIRTKGRFAPTWNYTYTINGKTYEGYSAEIANASRLDFHPLLTDAKSDGERRPLGSEVQVYYDPQEPHRSVLDPLPYNENYELILKILGVLVTIISLVGLWAIIRQIKIMSTDQLK